MKDVLDLIDLSGEAMILLDHDCNIKLWNGVMQKISGLDSDNVEGKCLFHVIPELKNTNFSAKLENYKGEKSESIELSISFKANTSVQYFSVSLSPISKSDKKHILLILHPLLFTKKTKIKYKSLIADSPIATAIYSLHGRAKYFNKAYAKLWGAKGDEEVKNLSDYNLLEDEQIINQGIRPYIQRAIKGETTELPPITYNPGYNPSLAHLKEGGSKHVKGHIFPIRNEHNHIEEVAIVLSDVTFQKQAEQILTETHLKFQMLTMGLPGVIYEYEESSDGENSYTYVSQGCQEMFGVSPEEILERPSLIDSMVHKDDLGTFDGSLMETRENGSSWQ
ncbi:MAG: PAS domain S-box protein, partial [Bacteroidota bacterium]